MENIHVKSVLLLGTVLGFVLGFGVVDATLGAEQGTTTGIASFYSTGKAKEYAPDFVVWTGTYTGASYTDAKKGPLHFGAWDCTGEVIIQKGMALSAGGFCAVTDPDGDKINLRWERTNIPGAVLDAKTKGTYLSGTGKYVGIQGEYRFSCTLFPNSDHAICQIMGGEYRIP
ncbi:MAG: hypothetical protein HY347_07395 [candidate division NC10 bacterium]|nr:hypothetical protein [candidate division NC10 bacterium]